MAERSGDQLIDPGRDPQRDERPIDAAPSVAGSGPTMRQREQRLAYGLIAPGVVIVLGLVLLPILWNVALSFRELRLIELREMSPNEDRY